MLPCLEHDSQCRAPAFCPGVVVDEPVFGSDQVIKWDAKAVGRTYNGQGDGDSGQVDREGMHFWTDGQRR